MKKFQKSSKKFYCEKCDYSSNRESQWRRHLSTTKHKMDNMDNTLDNSKSTKRCFECVCGKVYKYNSGLSKHKKKCTLIYEERSHLPVKNGRKLPLHLVVNQWSFC